MKYNPETGDVDYSGEERRGYAAHAFIGLFLSIGFGIAAFESGAEALGYEGLFEDSVELDPIDLQAAAFSGISALIAALTFAGPVLGLGRAAVVGHS